MKRIMYPFIYIQLLSADYSDCISLIYTIRNLNIILIPVVQLCVCVCVCVVGGEGKGGNCLSEILAGEANALFLYHHIC